MVERHPTFSAVVGCCGAFFWMFCGGPALVLCVRSLRLELVEKVNLDLNLNPMQVLFKQRDRSQPYTSRDLEILNRDDVQR